MGSEFHDHYEEARMREVEADDQNIKPRMEAAKAQEMYLQELQRVLEQEEQRKASGKEGQSALETDAEFLEAKRTRDKAIEDYAVWANKNPTDATKEIQQIVNSRTDERRKFGRKLGATTDEDAELRTKLFEEAQNRD